MRSSLFEKNLQPDDSSRMSLPNARLLQVRLDGELFARQGAMVAYQGAIDFAYRGAGGFSRMLKKALTGEGVPLMSCSGLGDLFLAHHGCELHVLELESDSIVVNGGNVVAFDPELTWDIRKVEGATIFSGDLFNMTFSGTGNLVLSAYGTPLVLDASESPTFTDIQSAIAWSGSLTPRLVRTAKASALIGRGSGEAYQFAFDGPGSVVIQSSEGPWVPKHDHKGLGDWLG